VPITPTKKEPKIDPDLGREKLAEIWAEMPADKLKAVVETWKDPELAKVLTVMDSGKVTQLLAVLDPKRAAALSRMIQSEASVVSEKEG
jgi:flagellar motility protein MotE (MotC chaperone)